MVRGTTVNQTKPNQTKPTRSGWLAGLPSCALMVSVFLTCVLCCVFAAVQNDLTSPNAVSLADVGLRDQSSLRIINHTLHEPRRCPAPNFW